MGDQVDIRMKGFLSKKDLKEVIQIIRQMVKLVGDESISFRDALNRVLAEDIDSQRDVPPFSRAAMDGYGVKATDTFGASRYNPVQLKLIGEILAGEELDHELKEGEAVRIMTGGRMPKGADAVVMAEYAEEKGDQVWIYKSLQPKKNLMLKGEDIKKGDIVLKKGRRLKPQDIGVLASIGKIRVKVYKKPKVAIIVTGNELVHPEDLKNSEQLVDSTSYMLEGLIKLYGGIPKHLGIIKDKEDDIFDALKGCKEDIIVVTGGTGIGKMDYAPIVVSRIGELLVHGVAMRPASPTGLGFIDNRPVFLLSGNPVAAMVGFEAFVAPAISLMQGEKPKSIYCVKKGKVIKKVVSEIGRTDFVRVKIKGDEIEPLRITGSAILTSTIRADGFIVIDKESEGLKEGEEVEVFLY